MFLFWRFCLVFNFFNYGEDGISVEIMVCVGKVFTCWDCIWFGVICIASMFIKAFVEVAFAFAYVLDLAFFAFHQIYDMVTSAVGSVINFKCFLCDVALKCCCVLNLVAAQVSKRCSAGATFAYLSLLFGTLNSIVDYCCLSYEVAEISVSTVCNEGFLVKDFLMLSFI